MFFLSYCLNLLKLILSQGACIDEGSSIRCQCPWTFYGDKCEHQRRCGSHTCKNGGGCTEDLTNPAGYFCTCAQGIFI